MQLLLRARTPLAAACWRLLPLLLLLLLLLPSLLQVGMAPVPRLPVRLRLCSSGFLYCFALLLQLPLLARGPALGSIRVCFRVVLDPPALSL
jgi:hypothetical protein